MGKRKKRNALRVGQVKILFKKTSYRWNENKKIEKEIAHVVKNGIWSRKEMM